jgi:fructan beta-fructosidase
MKVAFALAMVLGMACARADTPPATPLYEEQYRPQFHFSPPQQWMNDPNGMVYYAGEYHLFYQYNPYANRWGPMHWGHAISHDLVHWDNEPIALFPDRHGTIFSGSAVADVDNTSGLGSASSPPLVAIFTYHDHLAENLGQDNFQTQGLAYSLDRGRNWTKYPGNPVLANSGSRDFRDPKVFWSSFAKRWVMILAVHDHVAFYSSADLKAWTFESNFGQREGAHGGVWECPDLIDMPVVGSGERKAVLLVSINPGGPNGGSATQYFVGRFDGHAFEKEAAVPSSGDSAAWIDYGTDNYAGSTWSGSKPGDDRQLYLGWMSNWQYANNVPTQRWRSAFTVPRELSLVRTKAGRLEVRSLPVRELQSLRTGSTSPPMPSVSTAMDLTSPESNTGLFGVDLSLNTRRAKVIQLVFSNELNQRTVFRIDKTAHRYEVDRSASGTVDFSPVFALPQFAPMPGNAEHVTISALVDHSSIELFINHGETALTTIVFPTTPYTRIGLQGDAPIRLEGATVFGMKSIWHNQSSSGE